jgi:hypothetical protein
MDMFAFHYFSPVFYPLPKTAKNLEGIEIYYLFKMLNSAELR